MRRVILESPYAGDVLGNTAYAQLCMADSLRRGEAPLASHLLYTQPGILDDTQPEQRRLGIDAGFAWGEVAQGVAVYVDKGISSGMALGILAAYRREMVPEYRSLAQSPEEARIRSTNGPALFAEAVLRLP